MVENIHSKAQIWYCLLTALYFFLNLDMEIAVPLYGNEQDFLFAMLAS